MERRHFQIVADALKAVRPVTTHHNDPARVQFVRTVHVMADALARQNPRFNRERFYVACGESE